MSKSSLLADIYVIESKIDMSELVVVAQRQCVNRDTPIIQKAETYHRFQPLPVNTR